MACARKGRFGQLPHIKCRGIRADREEEEGGGGGGASAGGKERSRECGASRKGTHVDLLINALESQLAVAVTSPAPGGHTIDFGNKTESASLS